MRRQWVGLAVALTLPLWACSSGGDITGHITVAPGYDGQGVFAGLWHVPARLTDPTDPNSALEAIPGDQATFLGLLAVGVADTRQEAFKYTFYGLDRGLYFVGTFLWDNQGTGPDFATDISSIDENTKIEVNPSISSKTTLVHDLYLGTSAPDKSTISGTVHLEQLSGVAAFVILMTDNPYTGSGTVLDQHQLPTTGNDLPYTFYNAPQTKPPYVLACADTNKDSLVEFDQDFCALALRNPVVTDVSSNVATDVDIWLGPQAPNLGSIKGQVKLTTPLSSSIVTIRVFSSDYSMNQGANVVGVVNVSGTMTDTLPFQIPSMPLGTVYLDALIQSPGFDGTQLTGESWYAPPNPSGPTPIQLTAAAPNVSGIVFTVGAGHISGHIDFGTVETPDGGSIPAQGWVAATQTEGNTLFIRGYNAVAVTPGASVPYELLGLQDSTFGMSFVADLDGSGDLFSNINNGNKGVTGTPGSATITLGSPDNQVDFTYPAQ